jgi:hypothetical protein
VSKPYQVLSPTALVPAPDDVLERLAREGARRMLQDALERGVDHFLGRVGYQRRCVPRVSQWAPTRAHHRRRHGRR